jgi:chromosome partitioning protein
VIVVVANGKGGVGKTTTAIFVAHALLRATGEACTLIDADPQASAARWARLAAGTGKALEVTVRERPSTRLAALATGTGTANVVIDTPPGSPEILAAAIDVADLVLVPTSPSALDISVTRQTLDTVTASGTQFAVLLTRTRRTKSVGGAEAELLDAGAKVLSTHIPLREGLAMAFGRPVRELHGYDLAVAEILGYLPEQPYSVEAVQERVNRRPMPLPRPVSRPRPTGREWTFDDDALIAQLRTSVARLTR